MAQRPNPVNLKLFLYFKGLWSQLFKKPIRRHIIWPFTEKVPPIHSLKDLCLPRYMINVNTLKENAAPICICTLKAGRRGDKGWVAIEVITFWQKDGNDYNLGRRMRRTRNINPLQAKQRLPISSLSLLQVSSAFHCSENGTLFAVGWDREAHRSSADVKCCKWITHCKFLGCCIGEVSHQKGPGGMW